jgi:hypothetical protein
MAASVPAFQPKIIALAPAWNAPATGPLGCHSDAGAARAALGVSADATGAAAATKAATAPMHAARFPMEIMCLLLRSNCCLS